jgi:hypothetical protein
MEYSPFHSCDCLIYDALMVPGAQDMDGDVQNQLFKRKDSRYVMHNNHCTHAFKFLFRLSFLGSAPVWIHVHK